MAFIDPTTVRLSDSFLLSDFMGCDSVYRRGLPNQISSADDCKIQEGKYLAENLEIVQDHYGPLSITYGYISPELSRKIITYQDPNIPSYHKWDAGAAADIVPHAWLLADKYEKNDDAPIFFAQDIAGLTHFSRLITYSESEIVCFGTRLEEKNSRNRAAFYENRYILGKNKPKFIRYPTNPAKFDDFCRRVRLEDDWRGRGHPSYHGNGRKQFEHIRLGDYALMSDFLYDSRRVHRGESNIPWNSESKAACCFEEVLQDAATTISNVVEFLGRRISIVSAFKRSSNPAENWKNCFRLEIVPPVGVSVDDIAHFVSGYDESISLKTRNMRSGIKRLVMVGGDHEES